MERNYIISSIICYDFIGSNYHNWCFFYISCDSTNQKFPSSQDQASMLTTSPSTIFGKELNRNQSSTNHHPSHRQPSTNHQPSSTSPIIVSNHQSSKNISGKESLAEDNCNSVNNLDKLDPRLFPYLSKTFGGSALSIGSLAGVGMDDVNAAAAMLTLKHGHDPLTALQGGIIFSLKKK